MPMTNPYVRQWSDVVQGTVDSAANFAKGASSILDQKLREQAELDVKRMQLNLEDQTNQFMLELQQGKHGGIENWEQATQDFLQRAQASDDKNSPFYCKNQYTAKLYNQTFGANEVAVKDRVATQVWGLYRDEERQKMTESLNQIANSSADPQLKIDQSADLIDNAQRAGWYSKPEAEQLKAESFMLQHDAVVNAKYKEYYAQGMTPSEIEKKLNGEDMGLLMGGEEYASKLDKKAMIEKSCQFAQSKIRQTQDENTARWQDENTMLRDQIWAGTIKPDIAYGRVMSKIRFYENTSNLDLTSSQRRQLIEDLKGMLEPLKNGDAKSASKAALKSELQNKKEEFYAKVINGTLGQEGYGLASLYDAKELWLEEVRNAKGDDFNNSQEVQDFMTGFKQYAKKVKPELIAGFDKLQKLPKDITKSAVYKKMVGTDEQKAKQINFEIGEYLWDHCADMDFSKITPEYLTNVADEYIQKFYAKGLDYSLEQLKGSDSKFAAGIRDTSNDMVFTDITGQQVFVGGERTKEGIKNIEAAARYRLSKILDIDENSINQIGYTPTNQGTDTDSTMVFTAEGKQYKYEANEKGNAILYTRDDENSDWTEMSQETAKERATKKRKETIRRSEEEIKKLEKKNEKTAYELIKAASEQKIPIGDMTYEEWMNKGPAERKKLAVLFAEDNPEETKKILSKKRK